MEQVLPQLVTCSRRTSFEVDGVTLTRSHLIVGMGNFPRVSIAVHGATTAPVERQFFALPTIYENTWWELVDPTDEVAVRELVEGKKLHDVATLEAARAALNARRREDAERARADEVARTAAARVVAHREIVEASGVPLERQHGARVLWNLGAVEHGREHLASYKRPRFVESVSFEQAPRSTTGKILRHELAKWPVSHGQRV